MPDETVDATAYLIIEGERYRWDSEGAPVRGARIAGSRKKKPSQLTGDQVVVKVTVRLPKAAFEPLRPEALVVVPEELVQHAVTVEATPTVDNG